MIFLGRVQLSRRDQTQPERMPDDQTPRHEQGSAPGIERAQVHRALRPQVHQSGSRLHHTCENTPKIYITNVFIMRQISASNCTSC
jgi:hypothetical protein